MSRSVIVIKLGSGALLDANGVLDRPFIARMSEQVTALLQAGWQPVVVSSGAVAAGRGIVGNTYGTSVPEKQALAAIGQAYLVRCWQECLGLHGYTAAQILLANDSFQLRERYLNLQAMLAELFHHDVVPIINENDSVMVDELTVGDNDNLSALVATQLGARLLCLLTDIDAVYDADPRDNPQARRVARLEHVSDELIAAAGGGSGDHGRGGMRSKLLAARLAGSAGVTTIIAAAREPMILTRIISGEGVGTRIDGRLDGHGDPRRRWLALARDIAGTLTIDAGAVQALVRDGRSLLPVGVTAVEGSFRPGDTVAIVDDSGLEVARGLVGFHAGDLEKAAGRRYSDAVAAAGHDLPKVAVHRSNMLLVHGPEADGHQQQK